MPPADGGGKGAGVVVKGTVLEGEEVPVSPPPTTVCQDDSEEPTGPIKKPKTKHKINKKNNTTLRKNAVKLTLETVIIL